MQPIIIYPSNPRQYSVIKALLEEMKVKFKVPAEEKDETLMTEEEFYTKIDRAIKQTEAGEKIKLTREIEKDLFKGIL
ncbi:MAG: hypothetical protein J0H55_17250 [Chitinophagaceae bacterium]|nr:hypothetical protein [Chitinophagaceae bacterium]